MSQLWVITDTANGIKKQQNLPCWYLPDHIHPVVVWQRQAVRDARRHDDHNNLSRNGNGQFLFEALVEVFDHVQKDEARQAQDESSDVGAADVTEYRLDTLRRERPDSVMGISFFFTFTKHTELQNTIKTHINSRERPTETLCFHPQQVFQLRDDDLHGGCCGEASHQGLREIDRHEAKPEKTKYNLKEKE